MQSLGLEKVAFFRSLSKEGRVQGTVLLYNEQTVTATAYPVERIPQS